MQTLTIQKEIEIPMICTWKWKKEDYSVPLVFPLDGAVAHLFLDEFDAGNRDRGILFNAKFQLKFSPPPQKFLKALKNKTGAETEVAEKIYSYYQDVLERFESVALTAGNMKNLMPSTTMSIESFFKGKSFNRNQVEWWLDGEKQQVFDPKLKKGRKRINPLFKIDQIVTKQKWSAMQREINNGDFPSSELLELLRIRSKLGWRQKKVATIEASIIAETILREYGQQVLQSLGVSKNKLKSLKDELSFNTVLNIVLPLSLTKSEVARFDKHLSAVDLLRRIRNDVVHGNIKESDIEEDSVRKGIEGALVLVALLKKKTKAMTERGDR